MGRFAPWAEAQGLQPRVYWFFWRLYVGAKGPAPGEDWGREKRKFIAQKARDEAERFLTQLRLGEKW